jgi:hypothetical protein
MTVVTSVLSRSHASIVRLPAITLFLVGFLVLFLKLACIRWFAAYFVFLQFFTNVVLIASFLGMSCGCLPGPPAAGLARLFSFDRLGDDLDRCCDLAGLSLFGAASSSTSEARGRPKKSLLRNGVPQCRRRAVHRAERGGGMIFFVLIA